MSAFTISTPASVEKPLAASDDLLQRYQSLLRGEGFGSAAWLAEQLLQAQKLPHDLPRDAACLTQWCADRAARVAQQYAKYLRGRKAGDKRRYFCGRAHALHFLQQVAPTKCVDGAWLHGMLHHWPDPRYHGLIRTYLEELGDGEPACNHVLIYRRLLAEAGCHDSAPLADERYLQGCLQLALGMNTEVFLPEVIGYNLGYEQLPLHLLISAFELDELGLDPQYFRLHVTIDNASSGHACKAVQALQHFMPVHDESFYRRVAAGYRLNELGQGSTAIIASFDLYAEVVSMLERKRAFGQHMHSDYCRFDGRTVNQWLAEPGSVPAFLTALEGKGWIQRHQAPTKSRFWSLVEGSTAAMFGVFSAYEKQLLHDWIAGDWQPAAGPRRSLSHTEPVVSACDADCVALEEQLARLPAQSRVSRLIEQLAGNGHAVPVGLLATRLYRQLTGLN